MTDTIAITWHALSEAGIDTDHVSRTPDGCWHIVDETGEHVVSFGPTDDDGHGVGGGDATGIEIYADRTGFHDWHSDPRQALGTIRLLAPEACEDEHQDCRRCGADVRITRGPLCEVEQLLDGDIICDACAEQS